jgi:hypothetical protein
MTCRLASVADRARLGAVGERHQQVDQLGVAAALSGAVAFGHFPGMLLFLATILEQLDLALEHVLERDIHNARFGLMLTDNALELVLHQIARDKVNDLKFFGGPRASYMHQAPLDKALGRSFSDKVNFVRLAGLMSEEMAQTIGIMHGVRNEVYHVGLQHEAILPSLSSFYFNVACTYISSYKPPFLTWSSNQKLPERAKKYFRLDDDEFWEPKDFRQGCAKMARDVGHKPVETRRGCQRRSRASDCRFPPRILPPIRVLPHE